MKNSAKSEVFICTQGERSSEGSDDISAHNPVISNIKRKKPAPNTLLFKQFPNIPDSIPALCTAKSLVRAELISVKCFFFSKRRHARWNAYFLGDGRSHAIVAELFFFRRKESAADMTTALVRF